MRQTGRQVGRQAGRQTGRQTDRCLLFVHAHDWFFFHFFSLSSSFFFLMTSGLDVTPLQAKLLRKRRNHWRRLLNEQVYPMLQRWLLMLMKQDPIPMDKCCVIHAHLLYLFAQLPEDELSHLAVITMISSQIFLNSTYHFEFAAEKGVRIKREEQKERDLAINLGGVGETEIFDLYQKQLPHMLKFLNARPDDTSLVMEAVIKIITNREKPLSRAVQNAEQQTNPDGSPLPVGISAKDSGALSTTRRYWRSMDGLNCVGRFVPDMKMRSPEETAAAEKRRYKERGELVSDTEINVQLGYDEEKDDYEEKEEEKDDACRWSWWRWSWNVRCRWWLVLLFFLFSLFCFFCLQRLTRSCMLTLSKSACCCMSIADHTGSRTECRSSAPSFSSRKFAFFAFLHSSFPLFRLLFWFFFGLWLGLSTVITTFRLACCFLFDWHLPAASVGGCTIHFHSLVVPFLRLHLFCFFLLLAVSFLSWLTLRASILQSLDQSISSMQFDPHSFNPSRHHHHSFPFSFFRSFFLLVLCFLFSWLTLNTSKLQSLDESISSMPDFKDIFGEVQRVQAAPVKMTTRRSWYRLVSCSLLHSFFLLFLSLFPCRIFCCVGFSSHHHCPYCCGSGSGSGSGCGCGCGCLFFSLLGGVASWCPLVETGWTSFQITLSFFTALFSWSPRLFGEMDWWCHPVMSSCPTSPWERQAVFTFLNLLADGCLGTVGWLPRESVVTNTGK